MMGLRSVLRLALVLTPLTLMPATAPAAEPEVLIVLRDGRFEPAEVRVPAGVKVKPRDTARKDRAARDPRNDLRRAAEARALSVL